jgi:acyl-CoA synthetase (NDP forming)
MRKLPERDAEKLLRRYGIPFPKHVLARNEIAAAKATRALGFPVVMKISSPDILHKTDCGCVILNIRDTGSVRAAFKQIMHNARKTFPRARIAGVSLFQMVPRGTREVIVGAKQDPHFGPVLMFGLGGILVEVMRDVSFRVIPLERKDAREMIREIRGFKVLEGVRGQGPVDFKLLEDVLLKASKMVWENSGKGRRIQEMDINPLFISERKAWAADARIMVQDS